MEKKHSFSYTYRAKENQEVLNIRKKYLPQEETKLEELNRLDRLVQNSGTVESLTLGIGGCLVFGLGMCLAMEVIGNAMWPGILLGLVGTAAMLAAYPIYRRIFTKAKSQYAPRILELTAELSGTN
jgi:hypothetical protein